jgi:hypothetical protein
MKEAQDQLRTGHRDIRTFLSDTTATPRNTIETAANANTTTDNTDTGRIGTQRNEARHFLLFVGVQALGGVFRKIALGISIGDTDINDAICSSGPKTTDEQVSSEFTLVLVQVASNCCRIWDQLWHLDCGAT